MSEELIKNYLLWLNERGFDTFLPREIESPLAITSSADDKDSSFKHFIGSHPEIVIIISCNHPDLSQLPNDEKLLLGKLFKAIDLKFDQLAIIPCTSENEAHFLVELERFIEDFKINRFIVFGGRLGRFFETQELGYVTHPWRNGTYGICTYSLTELIENESLKRPAWDHLKLFQNQKSPQ